MKKFIKTNKKIYLCTFHIKNVYTIKYIFQLCKLYYNKYHIHLIHLHIYTSV